MTPVWYIYKIAAFYETLENKRSRRERLFKVAFSETLNPAFSPKVAFSETLTA